MNSYPKKCRQGRRRTKGLQRESNLKKRQVWAGEPVNFKHCLVNVSLMNVSGIIRDETCGRRSQPGHRNSIRGVTQHKSRNREKRLL